MRINVSMIHEARMIAKHVYKFVQRYDSGKKPKLSVVPNAPVLKCAPCLINGLRTEAATVSNGTALCVTHLVTR